MNKDSDPCLCFLLSGSCSNHSCPYRHVNVNANASICDGFLKGYCDDGNEVLVEPGLEVLFNLTLFTLHLISRRREGKKLKWSRSLRVLADITFYS